jgi:lipoprotein-anchoring transpeptidase ErfK/SrfK
MERKAELYWIAWAAPTGNKLLARECPLLWCLGRPRLMVELIAAIVVDLSEQKLYAYDAEAVLLRSVPVSTGKPSSPTPTGEGQVYGKHRSVTMRGSGFVAPNVPWALCVTPDQVICLHGAPWQEAAGQSFGVPRSHGCVRVPSPHARWLFEHTPLGTPVTIRP